jgi:hypothetical protein
MHSFKPSTPFHVAILASEVDFSCLNTITVHAYGNSEIPDHRGWGWNR